MGSISVPNRGSDLDSAQSKEVAVLLSQLEEPKFVRLFGHLVNSHAALPMGGADIGQPAVPLDLPDAELQFKLAGSYGSTNSFTSAWLFQIAHAPSFLWRDEFADNFFHGCFTRAFKNLAEKWPGIQNEEPRDGNHTWFRSPSEGCDYYYLFTNVCQDLSERGLETFSKTAHRLFTKLVHVPRKRHPAFGISTPQTVVENAYPEIRPFLLDLLNMPSSFYFLAREGRISVIPVTEHGAFVASSQERKSSPTDGMSTVVTSALPKRRHLSAGSFSDLETLINNRSTKEQDLQRFFSANPAFLFALDERYCEIRSHVCLVDSQRERLVPDFMARIEDSNIWEMIELKLPQSPITVYTQEIEKASASAARGIAELLVYRDFFSKRENRSRVTARFRVAPYEPCLVMLIGRGRRTHRYEWSSARRGFPKVQVVSYDYLFERARQMRNDLGGYTS